MNTDLMFSSKTDKWSTPREFAASYVGRYSLNVDVCADASNAVCEDYRDEADNGLAQDWASWRCWMNPPYGRGITGKWVAKAANEAARGALVVCPLPARTDTKGFHEYIYPMITIFDGRYGKAIEFVKGRLKFGDSKNAAPFPSMVVVFQPNVRIFSGR